MRKQDIPNCPQWLLDANTETEDVEYSLLVQVQWNGGDFWGGDFNVSK